MVSFTRMKFDASGPIYLQILKNFKQMCASGEVQDGDEMPSRRALAVQLGVNPNTIQKAYRLLEEEGLIASRGGAKSTVTLDEIQLETVRKELMSAEIRDAVNVLRAGGATKQQALEIFGRVWDEAAGPEGRES